MLKIFTLALLCFIKDASADCKAENKYDWSYHGPKNEPDHWGDKYPDCKKKNQSPVNIKSSTTLDIPKLQYTGFDKAVSKATVQNLGWTVMITPEDGVDRSVKLKDYTFTLKNIHFHFGQPGSEHLIKDEQYAMEIHFYGYDEDKKKPAVVAALMQLSKRDNPSLDSITGIVSDVKYRDDSTELGSDLLLTDLLPKDSGSYYLYTGSNSVPPCDPGYTWLVLKELGQIGRNQVGTWMTLYSVGQDDASDDCLMGPNNRPAQYIYDRSIISPKK